MKKQIFADVFNRSILALAMILATGYLSGCSGQSMGGSQAAMSPVAVPSVESAKEKDMAESKMMDRCMEMKQQKQKMLEDRKTQDTELTAQLLKMNRATKKEKMPLMAAMITSMVEQRITMDARKAKMDEEMMKHMMQHMQMGKESMSQCPMMKGMKGMDEKSGDAQKEQK